MNFMSHNSNHNVGKGPFIYKQTYLANYTQLFNAVVYTTSTVTCKRLITRSDQAAFMVNIGLDEHFLAVIVTPNPCLSMSD